MKGKTVTIFRQYKCSCLPRGVIDSIRISSIRKKNERVTLLCSTLIFFSLCQVLKQSVAEGIDVVVNDAGDAEEHNACGADEECEAGVIVGTESGNG